MEKGSVAVEYIEHGSGEGPCHDSVGTDWTHCAWPEAIPLLFQFSRSLPPIFQLEGRDRNAHTLQWKLFKLLDNLHLMAEKVFQHPNTIEREH